MWICRRGIADPDGRACRRVRTWGGYMDLHGGRLRTRVVPWLNSDRYIHSSGRSAVSRRAKGRKGGRGRTSLDGWMGGWGGRGGWAEVSWLAWLARRVSRVFSLRFGRDDVPSARLKLRFFLGKKAAARYREAGCDNLPTTPTRSRTHSRSNPK